MRLSRAIREGCKHTTKTVLFFSRCDGGACALGAALIATGDLRVGEYVPPSGSALGLALTHWPALARKTGYETQFGTTLILGELIMYVNDTCPDVTREEIASWVEWLEQGGAL